MTLSQRGMRDIFELYEFFVEGKDSLSSHVLLHISEPNMGDHKKGYLFAICEIQDGSLEQIQELQHIIDDIEAAYYDDKESPDNDHDPFESTIEFMNRRSEDILAHSGVVDCFVGVARGKELVFTIHGKPYAHVSYRKEGTWKHIDLIGESEENPAQLFDSVTQGHVATGDYIFVATPSVGEHFSPDRLEKLFSTRPIKEVADHIQRTLASLKSDQSFGGMLIYRPFQHEVPKTGKQPKHSDKGSEDSLNTFVTKQRDTEEILSPPLFAQAKKKFSGVFAQSTPERQRRQSPRTETNYRPRKTSSGEQEPLAEKILVVLGKGLFMGVVALLLFLKKMLLGIWKLCTALFFIITNYHQQRTPTLSTLYQAIERKKKWFIGLPILSKLLLIAATIFLIAFAASISYMNKQEIKQQEAKHQAEVVQAIQDKQAAAEASLIYNDTPKALTLLQEAKQLLTQLPDETEQQLAQKQEFADTIEQTLLTLRKMTMVEAVPLATLPVPEGITLHGLVQIDTTLLAFNKEHEEYFTLDITTKQVQTKQDQAAKRLLKASTPKENDKVVFLTTENGLAEYDKTAGGMVKKDVRFPNANSDIVDIMIYNRRLYSLDPINNQLYKHNQTQTGYEQGTPWIQDASVNIDNAVSFAIDGDIFILESTGNIVKLSGGRKVDFSINGLDPLLENPVQLWTYNDVEYIYILEPTSKRIVVLNKQGGVHTQYTNAQWQNPQAMIVDIDNKRIFVLDSNTIYQVSI